MRFALILTLCLVGVASAGSLNKRFIGEETFKQQAAELQANFEKLREALLNRFQNNGDVSAEVTVEKRDLREAFDNFNKFAQTKTQEAFRNIQRAIDNLFKKSPFFNNDDEDTTEHPIVKRNVFQELERMNSKAQAQAQKVFDSLQRAFSSIFMPFKPNRGNDADEDSTERSVAKRDIFDHFARLNDKIQNQAQKAFNQLRRVFDDLFQKHPEGIEIEIEDDGVVTERTIEKRDIFDYIGRINEKAQEEAAKIFSQFEKTFGDLFKHHDDDDDEDSTEISIQKRDIFDFVGELNEKIQDQAAKMFNQFKKPSPKPDSKPEVEVEVEEIEVVTAA